FRDRVDEHRVLPEVAVDREVVLVVVQREARALRGLVVDVEHLPHLGLVRHAAHLEPRARRLADVVPRRLAHRLRQLVLRPREVEDQRDRVEDRVRRGARVGSARCVPTGQSGSIVMPTPPTADLHHATTARVTASRVASSPTPGPAPQPSPAGAITGPRGTWHSALNCAGSDRTSTCASPRTRPSASTASTRCGVQAPGALTSPQPQSCRGWPPRSFTRASQEARSVTVRIVRFASCTRTTLPRA